MDALFGRKQDDIRTNQQQHHNKALCGGPTDVLSAHAGVTPPDINTWPDPEATTILRIAKSAGMELADANGNPLESQWMHLHFDGDPLGRTVTLTVQVCVLCATCSLE